MPSWTSVKTWVSETLTSSDLNTYVRDDLEYLKAQTDQIAFSGVIVDRAGVAQSIPDSAYTAISFTREILDVGGWIAVPSTTITVPASAIPTGYTTVVVLINFRVEFAANATGIRKVRVLNGGTVVAGSTVSAASADTTDLVGSRINTAVAADTFTMEVWQSSTGSLNAVSHSLDIAVFKPYA